MNNNQVQNTMGGGLSYADNRQTSGQMAVPQSQESVPTYDVKSIVINDLNKIQKLVDDGVISNTQGQYLVNYVINKAYDMVNNAQGKTLVAPNNNAFAEFEAENAGFFNKNGRAEVLEYLKNSGFEGDKDEISVISKMIENLENGAIERYLKQTAYEKTLNNENEIAKQRLRANAQNSNFDDAKARVFTREQIGKMSGAEFAKYEKAIMEQLRKGLIK